MTDNQLKSEGVTKAEGSWKEFFSNIEKNWWLCFVGVIVLWVASWILIDSFIAEGKDDGRGVFGDKFGAINALFSGLAFAGVWIAIQQQKIEIKIQKKELKRTKKIFDEQNRHLEQQSFENTFFNLLKLWSENLNNTKYALDATNVYIGVSAFAKIFDDFFHLYGHGVSSRPPTERKDIEGHREEIYKYFIKIYKERQDSLDHYFSIFEEIIYFINAADEKIKYKYFRIFFAVLSQAELRLIFYHYLVINGPNYVRDILSSQFFWEKVDSKGLVKESDIIFYPMKSYGSRIQYKNFIEFYKKSEEIYNVPPQS